MKLIKLYVRGGVVEIDRSTIPDGYAIQLIDYDNVEDDATICVWNITEAGEFETDRISASSD